MLNLRKAREAAGLTQEQLAYKAGVAVKTVIRTERTGAANSRTVSKFADALGVEVGDLFEKATA
jgi:transcriptional regulator with XRE-family HTH domain